MPLYTIPLFLNDVFPPAVRDAPRDIALTSLRKRVIVYKGTLSGRDFNSLQVYMSQKNVRPYFATEKPRFMEDLCKSLIVISN